MHALLQTVQSFFLTYLIISQSSVKPGRTIEYEMSWSSFIFVLFLLLLIISLQLGPSLFLVFQAHTVVTRNSAVWCIHSCAVLWNNPEKRRQQTNQQPCQQLCGDLMANHTNQTGAFLGQWKCSFKRNYRLCHSKQPFCNMVVRTTCGLSYVQLLWCHSLLCNSPWTLISWLNR